MLFEAFKQMRRERPGDPAFLVASGDRSLPINWRQFTDDIDLVVRLVKQYARNDKVVLLGENSYEWIVAHAATMFAGACVVPLDVNLSAREIADRIRVTGATVLVYSALYVEKAHEVRALVPGIKTGGFGSLKTERFLDSVRRLFVSNDSIWNQDSVDVSRVSTIVFTSGTTSVPRGAELTIESIETTVRAWGDALSLKPGDRTLMLLPLHHIYGLCASYLFLARGVALGVCPDFRRLYDAVERFRVNYVALVPALAEILAQKIEHRGKSAEDALGQPIDWILTGGAPMSRIVYERLAALGIRTLTAYGLTETTALYSIEPYSDGVHVCSAGKAVNSHGVETRVSESGELLVRGPSVMKGYFGEPERTAKVIDADGWFHTGDIGHIDEDGYVWITGRASRTIVLSSGKKVAPEELEAVLTCVPGIKEALVSGDSETREIKAEIYGDISQSAALRAVGELNLNLPVYKRIKNVVVRSTPFERTASGKIRV